MMHSLFAKNMHIKTTYLWGEGLQPMENERVGWKIMVKDKNGLD
jgi:hypothetical protein